MKNTTERTALVDRHLDLPMHTFFSVRRCAGRTIAHALNFDLVTTGETAEEALQKLRNSVKHHIEFGFEQGLSQEEILCSAPMECWDRLRNASLRLGEDIEIENYRRIQTFTQTAIDEHQPSLAGA